MPSNLSSHPNSSLSFFIGYNNQRDSFCLKKLNILNKNNQIYFFIKNVQIFRNGLFCNSATTDSVYLSECCLGLIFHSNILFIFLSYEEINLMEQVTP